MGPGTVWPLVLGAGVLGAQLVTWFVPTHWWGTGLRVAVLAGVVVLVVRWAVSDRHVLASWGACLVAAAGAAFLAPPYAAAPGWLMLVSDVTGAVIVVSVLTSAYRRLGRSVPGLLSLPGLFDEHGDEAGESFGVAGVGGGSAGHQQWRGPVEYHGVAGEDEVQREGR